METFTALLNIDELAILTAGLISFIAFIIGSFSIRYLRGDQAFGRFFLRLAGLVVALLLMVSSDHLALFWVAWMVSNYLLVRLMIHKSSWAAARASGVLAGRMLGSGGVLIGGAFFLMFFETGETSLQWIFLYGLDGWSKVLVLSLLILGAMVQSAIWPFHKWLLSSLNSPTPVSALMHAGLVNGGGFLLVRFSPLLFGEGEALSILFMVGIFTTVLGTFWKLLQSDVKRMLACSTMSQMGFMIVQCGLGLFPAAVTHLCWHGFFKAYLFLASGGAAQENRYDKQVTPTVEAFVVAIICGIGASYGFCEMSGYSWKAMDTRTFLLFLTTVAGAQFALTLLRTSLLKRFVPVAVLTALVGAGYGYSVSTIESFLSPLGAMQPHPLSLLHFGAAFTLFLVWSGFLFREKLMVKGMQSEWFLKLYMRGLNRSQPAPGTLTPHRNLYAYTEEASS